MTLIHILAIFTGTCRCCGVTLRHEVTVSPAEDHPELPLGDAIELACHEHLEAEGWVDSRCKFCTEILLIGNTEPETT